MAAVRATAGAAAFALLGLSATPPPEPAGEAQLGFQQFYLMTGSQRVSNVSGLFVSFRQFLPGAGLMSGSLAPAASEGRFQTGESFLQLKGVPWLGHYWTFQGGDFRLPGRLVQAPFNNLFYPEVAGRGAWVEATHGKRTVGFFAGAETLAVGFRVPLRLQVPQVLVGSYYRQQVGTRLLLSARQIRYSNDLQSLKSSPHLLTPSSTLKSASTVSLDSLFTLAGPLKWYGEVAWSATEGPAPAPPTRRVPLSAMAGPLLETSRFTLRANYVYQGAFYLPLLGYHLGDRRGSHGEFRFRPFEWAEIHGGANEYRNNLERDPARPSFRTASQSAGASVRLPGRFTIGGQLSLLGFSSRPSDASPWEDSRNQQVELNLSRPIRRHGVRLAIRDFRQLSANGAQRQRAAEVQDVFRVSRLILGAAVRIQRLIAAESRTSVFFRGSGQIHLGRVSAYANVESGNDLANRTAFATSAVNTTVIGGAVKVGRSWEFQVEAYRNNLISELNPQRVFLLQGQGAFVPTVLAGFNQWSLYFRLNKQFRWGKAPVSDLAQYAIAQTPLKGTVEGFVFERALAGARPAAGIPVSLDESQVVQTDQEGRFRFTGVPEGTHKIGLAMEQLPADFDPGARSEGTVMVQANRVARIDFDVIPLVSLAGKVTGPEGESPERIIVWLQPLGRFTTPDRGGIFGFHNLREGDYEFVLDEKSLPPFAVILTRSRIPVSARQDADPPPADFQFEVRNPEKPARVIFERK